MSIKINSYGGIFTWYLRKYFSHWTSKVALEYAAEHYEKQIINYINLFNESEKTPLFKIVNIETVNRCNGSCDFCPANIRAEKRKRMVMSQKIFEKIIRELKEIDWSGQLFFNVNNEPLLDKEILKRIRYAGQELGGQAILSMFTNGTLLTENKLVEMAEAGLRYLIINDYSEKYNLSKGIKQLYVFLRRNRQLFQNMNITINRRYSQEILATRAGSAPNKKKRNNNVIGPCIYPYTDITIFPDGKVGLCCNDCYETTDYGNVGTTSLKEIWENSKWKDVREKIARGRVYFDFCRECDVVDSGFREKIIQMIDEER